MRKFIYAAGIILFVLGTVYKARTIVKQSAVQITSIKKEWEKNGKPVITVIAKKERIWVLQKVAAQYAGGGIFRTAVSRDIYASLRVGQSFEASKNGLDMDGEVSYIAPHANPVTGLFSVKLKVAKDIALQEGAIITAYVRTGSDTAIKIPHAACQNDSKGDYCWVIKGDKALKTRIYEVKDYNGRYYGVGKGLQEGARVCVEGMDKLTDNDKVNIIEGARDDR